MVSVTWDNVNKGSGVVISTDGLTSTIPNQNNVVRATIGRNSGKWFWEIKFSQAANVTVGIVDETISLNTAISSNSKARMYYGSTGEISYPRSSYGSNYSVNDVIGVFIDIDNDKLRFYKNGVNQGEIANFRVNLNSLIYPSVSSWASGSGNVNIVNFGASSFSFLPSDLPSGTQSYDGSKVLVVSNKTLILSNGGYKKYGNKAWTDLSYTSPTSTNFINDGFEVSDLNRSVQTLKPQAMTQDTTWTEGGKVFKKSIDLKKYFDIRSINITN